MPATVSTAPANPRIGMRSGVPSKAKEHANDTWNQAQGDLLPQHGLAARSRMICLLYSDSVPH